MAGTPELFTVAAMGRQAKSIIVVTTGQEHPMSFALITALHHTNSSHHTGPWYIALPLLAVVIGVTIWRWRRGGGGGGLFGGSGDQ
jgi:hypothetical protein